jgi:hypothetical protein
MNRAARATPTIAGMGRPLSTRVQAHLGSQQVAKVVYGSIIGLALVVALEAHPPSSAGVVVLLLGTAVAVGLAEVYSEVVGIETSRRRKVTRGEWAHLLEEAGAVAFGVAFPAVFFGLAALHVLEQGTAFSVAKWSGLGLIGFYGFWAARFSGKAPHHAVLRGVLVALVGAGLVLLKSLVH